MSEEFDADAAAAKALGEQADGNDLGSTDDDVQEASSEPSESSNESDTSSSSSTSKSIKDMALSTDPDTPLEKIESPYDPEKGGLRRVYRGLQKALGFDGTPAILDLVVGGIEEVSAARDEGGATPDGADDAEQGDVDEDVEDLSEEAREIVEGVGAA